MTKTKITLTLDELQKESYKRFLYTSIIALKHQIAMVDVEIVKPGLSQTDTEHLQAYRGDSYLQTGILETQLEALTSGKETSSLILPSDPRSIIHN